MTEYQPTEQDKVLLDYAQTAQRRADPWQEFQYINVVSEWCPCTSLYNPASHNVNQDNGFRRKPRTCKLIGPNGKEYELPVPTLGGSPDWWVDICNNEEDDKKWSAALREIAKGEGGQ